MANKDKENKIKKFTKEAIGKTLNQFNKEIGIADLVEINKNQDRILNGILSQVNDENTEKTEKSNIITLDNSTDGIVELKEIQGDTNVNVSKIAEETPITHVIEDKEGNAISLDDITEGAINIDNIQGNTMVNCNKEADKELILMEDLSTEGYSNITLNKGVDGGKVDIALEGNTMVNVCDQKDPVAITKSYTVETGNHVALQGEYDGKCRPVVTGNTLVNCITTDIGSLSYTADGTAQGDWYNIIAKPNTIYTVIANVTKNTIDNNFALVGWNTTLDNTRVLIPNGFTGTFVQSFTTKSSDVPKTWSTDLWQENTTGEIVIDSFMILEGDYTNKPIPDYFEGLQSSFEDKVVPENLATNIISGNVSKYNALCKYRGIKQNTTYTLFIKNNSTTTLGFYLNENVFKYKEYNVDPNSYRTTLITPTKTLDDTILIKALYTMENVNFECYLVEGDYTNYDFTDYDPTKAGKYKVDYVVTGKNKFDKDNCNVVTSKYLNSSTGEILSGADLGRVLTYYPILPNITYTISKKAGNKCFYALYDKDKVFINGAGNNNNNNTITLTTSNNARFISLYWTNEGTELTDIDLQIEEGDTATSYEPYKEYKKTFYLNSPLLKGDTIEQQGDNVVHVHRSELRAYETDDELTLHTDMTNTLVAKATPQYEVISQNDTILCDSYVNGHLDVDSVVPIEKVTFRGVSLPLKYLYTSAPYIIQFESDKEGIINEIGIGGTLLKTQSVIKGINKINITTSSTISNAHVYFIGIGFNASNIVVTEATDQDFGYFEGMKSVGELEENKIEILSSNKNLVNPTQTLSETYGIELITDGIYRSHIGGKYYTFGLSNSLIKLNPYMFNYAVQPIIKGKKYTISCKIRKLTGTGKLGYFSMFGFDKGSESYKDIGLTTNASIVVNEDWQTISQVCISTDNADLLIPAWQMGYDANSLQFEVKDIQLEEGDSATDYVLHAENKKQILLNEPLRAVGDIKDKYVLIDGKWYIERNCGVRAYQEGDKDNYITDMVNTVYPLSTPTYEPINYNPFEVYSDVTHISNNSTIPCNMTIKNTGYNCLLKPSTTYTVSSNLGLNTVTTGADIGDSCLRFYDEDTSDVTTMKDVLVLEGDWTSKANLIPSNFSGIESAFEQELVTDENDVNYGKYKVDIKVVGKNLFDKSKIVLNKYQNSNVSTGNYSIIDNPSYKVSGFIRVKPNTNYFKTKGNVGVYYSLDKTPIKGTRIERGSKFTTPYNCHYVVFTFNIEEDISNWQLEEGDTATEYEPYKESTITFYLNEPLRGIGDVKDRVYIKNDKVVVERNCGSVTLDGSEQYKNVASSKNYFRMYIENYTTSISKPLTSVSDKFIAVQKYGLDQEYIYLDQNLILSINKCKLTEISIQGFKAWLQQNPTTVVYQLAKPVYEEVEYSSNRLILNTFNNESFNDSTLFLDTNISPKLSFKPLWEELVYVKSNTKYYIQFNAVGSSEVVINLGGTELTTEIVEGYNCIPITTPSESTNLMTIIGQGITISEVVVSEVVCGGYYKGLQSCFEEHMENGKYRVLLRGIALDGSKVNGIKLYINEPLRGVEGVKDRLCIKNGKLMVERKCSSIIFDGSNDEKITIHPKREDGFTSFLLNVPEVSSIDTKFTDVICDILPSNSKKIYDSCTMPNIYKWVDASADFVGVLEGNNVNVRQWLQQNPATIVYQLTEPTYEEATNEYGLPIVFEGYENGIVYIDSAVTPTTHIKYTSNNQLATTLSEAEEQNITTQEDINMNVITYMMDIDMMLTDMEMSNDISVMAVRRDSSNENMLDRMSEEDKKVYRDNTVVMLEKMITAKALEKEDIERRINMYYNKNRISKEQYKYLKSLL